MGEARDSVRASTPLSSVGGRRVAQVLDELDDCLGAVEPTAVVGDRDIVIGRRTATGDERRGLRRKIRFTRRTSLRFAQVAATRLAVPLPSMPQGPVTVSTAWDRAIRPDALTPQVSHVAEVHPLPCSRRVIRLETGKRRQTDPHGRGWPSPAHGLARRSRCHRGGPPLSATPSCSSTITSITSSLRGSTSTRTVVM